MATTTGLDPPVPAIALRARLTEDVAPRVKYLAHSDKIAPSGRCIYATEGTQFCPNGLAPACVTLGQKTACPVFAPRCGPCNRCPGAR